MTDAVAKPNFRTGWLENTGGTLAVPWQKTFNQAFDAINAQGREIQTLIDEGIPGPPGPAGPTGPMGPSGSPGSNGKTILNGTSDPGSGIGTDGDFYLNTTSEALFGPKTSGAWGRGVSLVGPTGPTGAAGANGTNGVDGKSVLNGTADPGLGTGNNGDFYINTTSNTLFGPKTAGVWGSGVSLVGPTGATGPTGPAGASGAMVPTRLAVNQVFTVPTDIQILFSEMIDFSAGSEIDIDGILVEVN